jgi:hypothetical protein
MLVYSFEYKLNCLGMITVSLSCTFLLHIVAVLSFQIHDNFYNQSSV